MGSDNVRAFTVVGWPLMARLTSFTPRTVPVRTGGAEPARHGERFSTKTSCNGRSGVLLSFITRKTQDSSAELAAACDGATECSVPGGSSQVWPLAVALSPVGSSNFPKTSETLSSTG